MSEPRVIKSAGPEYPHGPFQGHCYDGMGWRECSFWQRPSQSPDGKSRCMLFGGTEKVASEALRVCDKIYGVNYEGEP